jgi:hypothetical protein
VEAMLQHGGLRFVPVAEQELQSEDRSRRIKALRLLKPAMGESLHRVMQVITSDPEAKVRFWGLLLLQTRDTWSAAEEGTLASATSDPDSRVRDYAIKLRDGEKRSEVQYHWVDSSDFPDPGEEE